MLQCAAQPVTAGSKWTGRRAEQSPVTEAPHQIFVYGADGRVAGACPGSRSAGWAGNVGAEPPGRIIP